MKNTTLISNAESYDNIVVCVSGGKDSSALMLYALEHFPFNKISFVHAVIDIDHKETIGTVRAQAAFFNKPLIEVTAKHADGSTKGFISKLLSARTDRETGEKKENLFPDMCNRWCTSELKLAPIWSHIRTLKGSTLVLIGERRDESSQRSKLEAIRPNEKLSKAGRTVVDFSPILDMSESDVWSEIHQSGMPVHPCYAQGFSRASCAICIFSSDKEIALAAKTQPEIVSLYVEAESKINHTFRYKPATKKRPALRITVRDILIQENALHFIEQNLITA